MAKTPPEIRGKLHAVVAAHKSLENPLDAQYGDPEFLAVIGRRVLPLVAADTLSMKQPLLSALDLEVRMQIASSLGFCL
jgi:hypothetical protein